eukprot:1184784-Prorocentrum_minimum.AAC.1
MKRPASYVSARPRGQASQDADASQRRQVERNPFSVLTAGVLVLAAAVIAVLSTEFLRNLAGPGLGLASATRSRTRTSQNKTQKHALHFAEQRILPPAPPFYPPIFRAPPRGQQPFSSRFTTASQAVVQPLVHTRPVRESALWTQDILQEYQAQAREQLIQSKRQSLDPYSSNSNNLRFTMAARNGKMEASNVGDLPPPPSPPPPPRPPSPFSPPSSPPLPNRPPRPPRIPRPPRAPPRPPRLPNSDRAAPLPKNDPSEVSRAEKKPSEGASSAASSAAATKDSTFVAIGAGKQWSYEGIIAKARPQSGNGAISSLSRGAHKHHTRRHDAQIHTHSSNKYSVG